ncbi:MAG: chloramphenicol acetyltransferase [Bacteroidales bacterium]|jgi:chloramphenicol O-acetyltransferase type A|nr:chloramphenicol acetyltransferase [Bacteroidales bacterium]
MKKLLDIEKWNRKDHFNFFNQFEEPFYGITVEIDCTAAYNHCKQNNLSFFIYYLHCSLAAANSVDEFRYRISDNKVYIYDQIDASATINRDDNTFDFSYIPYHSEFNRFDKNAKSEIERIRNSSGLNPTISGDNVIHFSSVPWIKFSSLSHARSFAFNDSCPKISFGKMTQTDEKRVMPISVHVHHALIDGYHLGLFIDELQRLMNIS